MMLEILGRARNLNPARNFLLSIPKKSNFAVPLTDKFFNSLIRSYNDAGHFQESIKVFRIMKSMGISPSIVTFNSLFLILFKRGRLGMVYQLFDEMLKTYGVKPDLYTFNTLIRGYCMNSSVHEAFRMFKEMEGFGCQPDIVTYNTIVDGLCRAGKVGIARNVVDGMRKKVDALRPNVVTYTTLIRGYFGKCEIDMALDVFREMISGGIKPNEVTFNTIVKGLCEARQLDRIKEVLRECGGEDGSFLPDVCTFNTVMNAHCSREDLDEALKVFEKMKELNIGHDSATYSVLIRALCQKLDFDRAEGLLDELFEQGILLRDNDCTPLVAAYNPIFKYLCLNGKTRKAEKVFQQLMKRGTPDPVAYETMISGHCKEGTFKDGQKLLVSMLRRYFMPSVEIYESLIDGLLKKREPALAYDTLKKMLKSFYLPRTSTFHRVLRELIENSCSHDSAHLMMLMLNREIRPNINLSTDVVRLLYRSRMREKAVQLVGSLYENGYVVNVDELVSFLCQDKKSLEACELLLLSLKNDQKVGTGVCDAVLSGLCTSGRLDEAFRLYYVVLEKGTELPLSCFGDLRNALESVGRFKEAEFVSKRMVLAT